MSAPTPDAQAAGGQTFGAPAPGASGVQTSGAPAAAAQTAGGRAESIFVVSEFTPTEWKPEVQTGLPTGTVLMRKDFTGDIDGWAQTMFCYSFDEQRGGTYVAIESFTGSIGGHPGTCNIAHSATTKGTDRTDEFLLIVPGSGTDALQGISGSGRIVIDPDGTHHLLLAYTLDPPD